jgi:GNAT superfamily N-acetyltransferase
MLTSEATVAYPVADRPSLRIEMQTLDAIAFPAFMAASDLAPLWSRVYAEFPEYQLALHDVDSDAHLAHANAVPLVWNGSYGDLPRTAVEMVERALFHKRQGHRPNAAGALQAVVHPEFQGAGYSSSILRALAARTQTLGATHLFAPIRPSHKARYPLVRLGEYVSWQRPDGQPFDPWQRIHARLGATPVDVVDRWLTVSATPADWTRWTGQEFTMSGAYVLRGALVPVHIDLQRNVGRYVEPHLWMHYRL